jgi:hypothetical protein
MRLVYDWLQKALPNAPVYDLTANDTRRMHKSGLVSAIHRRNGMTGIVIWCSYARSFHGLELLVD